MNYLDDPQRQQILTRALSARTTQHLASVSEELNAWIAAHPEDKGIQWAFEQMALVELALQENSAPAVREVVGASS